MENNHEKKTQNGFEKAIVDDGTATDFDVEAALILDKHQTICYVWFSLGNV